MTTKLADVAILMATYNGSNWIIPQLSSIRSQIQCSYHLYVRDDGSTDRTKDLINEAAKSDLNIFIMDSCDISTGGAASNFLLMLSNINEENYDYISFSDQDDIWFPEKLRMAIDCIVANGADAYSSNLIAYDNYSIKAWFVEKGGAVCDYDYIFQGASAGCTYVLTSQTVTKIKLVMGDVIKKFPSEFSHDWTVYAICRSHGLKWIHDVRSFIAYRQHKSNLYGAKPGFLGLYSKLKRVGDGWYRRHILFLEKFISGQGKELHIMKSIRDKTISDRFFLMYNIFSFRRNYMDVIRIGLLVVFGVL